MQQRKPPGCLRRCLRQAPLLGCHSDPSPGAPNDLALALSVCKRWWARSTSDRGTALAGCWKVTPRLQSALDECETKDAGSARSSATGATEDAVSRPPV